MHYKFCQSVWLSIRALEFFKFFGRIPDFATRRFYLTPSLFLKHTMYMEVETATLLASANPCKQTCWESWVVTQCGAVKKLISENVFTHAFHLFCMSYGIKWSHPAFLRQISLKIILTVIDIGDAHPRRSKTLLIADKVFLLVNGSFTCMHGVNSILKVPLSLFQGTPDILQLVLEAGESLPSLSLTISLLIDLRNVILLCHLWRANTPCFTPCWMLLFWMFPSP